MCVAELIEGAFILALRAAASKAWSSYQKEADQSSVDVQVPGFACLLRAAICHGRLFKSHHTASNCSIKNPPKTELAQCCLAVQSAACSQGTARSNPELRAEADKPVTGCDELLHFPKLVDAVDSTDSILKCSGEVVLLRHPGRETLNS